MRSRRFEVNCNYCRRGIEWQMFGRAIRGGQRVSESWENEVGEVIDVKDWQEELGGGQIEPVRSQVREESSEKGSVGGTAIEFEGSLLLVRRI
jgi:hypothetical protein